MRDTGLDEMGADHRRIKIVIRKRARQRRRSARNRLESETSSLTARDRRQLSASDCLVTNGVRFGGSWYVTQECHCVVNRSHDLQIPQEIRASSANWLGDRGSRGGACTRRGEMLVD